MASSVTTVSTRGQVILPKPIRDQSHGVAGTRLAVEHTKFGVVLRPLAAEFPPTRPDDVFGCLCTAGPPKSVAQMEAGSLGELRRRHARGRY